MNITPRIFLLTGLLVIVSALAAWAVARQQALGIVHHWALRYAEKQVLYDKSRLVQPIAQEIASDRRTIAEAMDELATLKRRVATRFVEIDGKPYLAAMAYLQQIDWYEITLLDLEVVLPLTSFSGILLVYGLTLVAALLLFNLVPRRLVLRPLAQLDEAIVKVQDGQFLAASLPASANDEISCLIAHFKQMASTVCRAVALNRRLRDHAGQPIAFSVSIGGAMVSGDDVERMVSQADQALYAAKHAGRNCFRLFDANRAGAAVSGRAP